MSFFQIMLYILCAVMALSLYRVFAGPTLFDRLTGIGLIASKTLVILLLIGIITDQLTYYIDIALSYAILGFIGPLVLAKFMQDKQDIEQDAQIKEDLK